LRYSEGVVQGIAGIVVNDGNVVSSSVVGVVWSKEDRWAAGQGVGRVKRIVSITSFRRTRGVVVWEDILSVNEVSSVGRNGEVEALGRVGSEVNVVHVLCVVWVASVSWNDTSGKSKRVWENWIRASKSREVSWADEGVNSDVSRSGGGGRGGKSNEVLSRSNSVASQVD